jgi:serralysin
LILYAEMTDMSASTTVSGSSVANNWTGGAGGAGQAFLNLITNAPYLNVVGSGVSTITGASVLMTGATSVTVSASAFADESTGSNSINTQAPSVVFAAPNDTISSAAATTLFGSSGGLTTFAIGGAGSSISGGAGGIRGVASGANSTLIGGSGNNLFTVSGSNSLAVAGPGPGTTGINEATSTGPELIATSPTGTSGPLVAILGSGADTVLGGGGASTITGGSGSDVFGFIKGTAGGSEVIFNFTSKDNFAFGGYGSAGPISAEAVTTFGGVASDQITLTDGTKITLVGIDHKIF